VNIPLREVMLAPNDEVSLADINYPKYASVKLDGVYCLVYDGEIFSRDRKMIPNVRLKKHLEGILALKNIVFMGELWSPDLSFSEIVSVVRSFNKPIPESLGFHVFDCLSMDEWLRGSGGNNFRARLHTMYGMGVIDNVKLIPQTLISDSETASGFYNYVLTNNQEGIILRSPTGYYKHGRCTLAEDDLIKMKEMVTSDGRILEVLPARKMVRELDRVRSGTGKLERSHKCGDYEQDDKLGAFVVSLDDGRACKVGPGKGQTDAVKRDIWRNREGYKGKTVEFKHLKIGEKDVPRMGKFIRFREDLDASTNS